MCVPMGRLTTHVVDMAHGRPAAGMTVELAKIDGDSRHVVTRETTNAQGRCDKPLLDGDDFRTGVWELSFHVAKYYSARDVPLTDPPFLDVVTIRFGVADAEQHYHVPLLVTPWSHSTYRGS